MEANRIYSMNMISYILMKTDYEYTTGIDSHTGSVYYSFEEDLSDIICEYRDDFELQEFIAVFKDVRNTIRRIKKENRRK